MSYVMDLTVLHLAVPAISEHLQPSGAQLLSLGNHLKNHREDDFGGEGAKQVSRGQSKYDGEVDGNRRATPAAVRRVR